MKQRNARNERAKRRNSRNESTRIMTGEHLPEESRIVEDALEKTKKQRKELNALKKKIKRRTSNKDGMESNLLKLKTEIAKKKNALKRLKVPFDLRRT